MCLFRSHKCSYSFKGKDYFEVERKHIFDDRKISYSCLKMVSSGVKVEGTVIEEMGVNVMGRILCR